MWSSLSLWNVFVPINYRLSTVKSHSFRLSLMEPFLKDGSHLFFSQVQRSVFSVWGLQTEGFVASVKFHVKYVLFQYTHLVCNKAYISLLNVIETSLCCRPMGNRPGGSAAPARLSWSVGVQVLTFSYLWTHQCVLHNMLTLRKAQNLHMFRESGTFNIGNYSTFKLYIYHLFHPFLETILYPASTWPNKENKHSQIMNLKKKTESKCSTKSLFCDLNVKFKCKVFKKMTISFYCNRQSSILRSVCLPLLL